MKTILTAAALLALVGAARAEPVNYAIDPNHTTVIYEMMHMGTSTNRGRFDKKEGSVTLDRAAKTGKVEVTFETGSVNSGVPALNTHLMSKDFFDSATYPTAKFVGDKFTFDGDKVTEVAGNLTMLGKTNPVTLKAVHFNCYQNPMLKREVCGGDFDTTIKRSLWGITWGANYGFPDDVHLLIQVEAIKQ